MNDPFRSRTVSNNCSLFVQYLRIIFACARCHAVRCVKNFTMGKISFYRKQKHTNLHAHTVAHCYTYDKQMGKSMSERERALIGRLEPLRVCSATIHSAFFFFSFDTFICQRAQCAANHKESVCLCECVASMCSWVSCARGAFNGWR